MDQSLNKAPGITPPPELVQQWLGEQPGCAEQMLATKAAQWGADQELEAIIKLAEGSALPEKDRYFDGVTVASLRAARRPKPPSLKEQALIHFESFAATFETSGGDSDLIRRALEQLDG